ncbi:MAG: outer membrane lipoprotein carrier protein LolA [Desulfosalsimonas sp.]|uniref:LolA family protein n=1 Tax=Desulfosalsimonas sp. TaxID=3073848 RepID=UPI0039710C72
MLTKKWFSIIAVLCMLCLSAGVPPAVGKEDAANGKTVEEVIEKLNDHYGEKNFTANFRQESTLKAMDITDSAEGRAWFKHPGKMRWQYEAPETYLIVTDGDTLWIHRPADRQVVVGDAAGHFGGGRGASFLADITRITDVFEASLANSDDQSWRIKLIPRRQQGDLKQIYMEVNRKSLETEKVTTENIYGDITRIVFENVEFHPEMPDRLFDFEIPAGADVIQMEN